jgi:hypothetical protein
MNKLLLFACLFALLAIAAAGVFAAKPLYRLEREVNVCNQPPEHKVHADKYAVCKNDKWAPVIVNLHNGATNVLKPLREYEGMPVSTVVADPAQRNASLMSGKHRDYSRYEVLWTNGSTVGVKVSGYHYAFPDTPPKHAKCGGEAKLHEKLQQYYCPVCNQLISAFDAMKSTHVNQWAVLDLTSEKASSVAMPDGWLTDVGNDFAGGVYWFALLEPCVPACTKTQKLTLFSIHTTTGAKVTEFAVDVPYREKGPGYRTAVSPSGKTLLLVEYDELQDKTRGFLADPPVSALVVTVATKSVLRMDALMTTYGFTLDEKNDRLFLGSNQSAKLVVRKLSTGALIKEWSIPGGMAHLSLSADASRLYVFTKGEFQVVDTVKYTTSFKVPVGTIYPGIDKWMTADRVITTDDGLRAITPAMIRAELGPWGVPDPKSGFRVFLLP